MKTTVSSKGQIVLPVEIRQQDDVRPGQKFEIERIERGEYRLRGDPVPLLDGMIAATALTHGLTVATCNVFDFRKTGARVVDPFRASD
jgi:AbrB family looped-hinge helix DNA binding protein